MGKRSLVDSNDFRIPLKPWISVGLPEWRSLRRGQLLQHRKWTTAAKAETSTFHPKNTRLCFSSRALGYHVRCEIEMIPFPSWQLQKKLNEWYSCRRFGEKHVFRVVCNVSAWISAHGRSLTLAKYFPYKNKPTSCSYLVRIQFRPK